MALSITPLVIFAIALLNYGIMPCCSDFVLIDSLFKFGSRLLTKKGFDASSERDMMMKIITKIDNMDKAVKNCGDRIPSKGNFSERETAVIYSYNRDINYIIHLYDELRQYTTDDSIEDETLRIFSEICINDGESGLSYKLDNLQQLIDPSSDSDTDLVELLINPQRLEQHAAQRCGTTSLQQDINALYAKVSMNFIKGYVVMYHTCRIYDKFNSLRIVPTNEGIKDSYRSAKKRTKQSVLSVMSTASRDIRSCDAEIHEEGETYIELKWLFNAIIFNEVYLNQKSSCGLTCEDYRHPKFNPYSTLSSELDVCKGEIYDCFWQKLYEYCPTTKSSRRYDSFSSLEVSRCHDKKQISDKFASARSLFYSCSHCTCYCDDYDREGTSRTFSLRAVHSNSAENRVITGLRFVEINKVIYIQIQEGKFEPHETILESTVEWQAIDAFDLESSSTQSEDYFTIKYDHKSVDLDTVFSPNDRVLTGIKLSAKESHLRLEVKTHSFNYTGGILGDGDDDWISNDASDRMKIEIELPDIPTRANESITDARKNTYVDFRMSDWDKDTAQTAVPFIDAQSVVSDPPQPLSGAGLYYKRQPGYGGFIALKLVTYDYSAQLIEKSVHVKKSSTKKKRISSQKRKVEKRE